MPPAEMNWVWVIGAPLVRLALAIFFRMRIEGLDHVPTSGPFVVAPNHVSVLDGPSTSAIVGTELRRATRNLIAAEIFHGVRGWILRQADQIPVRRGKGDTGALDAAVAALEGGSCVGIFPEGRVSNDPWQGFQYIRSGLTRIALPTGAPVVPVGIWGAQTIWPQPGIDRRALFRRPPMAVVFGPPLVPTPGEIPSEFRDRYRAALLQVVDRARSLAGDPRLQDEP